MQEHKLWFEHALIGDDWHRDVLMSVGADGTIAGIRSDAPADGAVRHEGAGLPGIANVHSHAHQRAMAGLTERSGPGPDSFWTWRELMYRFLGRMTPEDLQAIAAQLYVECLKAGYTAVGEFQYLHHQPDGHPYETRAEMSLRTLAAAREAGIAITLLPTLYAFGGFGGVPAGEGQRRFLNDAEGFLRIVEILAGTIDGDADAALGISPHSLRAVTPELMAEALAGLDAIAPGAPVHIHVAEQVREVEECIAWSGGARPVAWLMDRIGIDARWCLIHATHMDEGETDRLAQSGAVAGLCPLTEANLGDGLFPAPRYLEAGGRIAIGSDSHVSRSPAAELSMLEYGQRLIHRSRNALAGGPGRSTGRTLFDRVRLGGAQIMGRRTGRFAIGARADIAVLDTAAPALVSREGDALLDSWIFASDGGAVRDVYVGGRQVVAGGRHEREDEIAARYRTALDRLLAEPSVG